MEKQLIRLREFINSWKINKTLLAQKMKMPSGTFKKKYSINQTKYDFTSREVKKLDEVISDLSKDGVHATSLIRINIPKSKQKNENL